MPLMNDMTKFVEMRCKSSRFQLLNMPIHIGLTSETFVVMVAKGVGSPQPLRTLQLSKDGSVNSSKGKSNPRIKRVAMNEEGCTHYGNKKHTQDTYFTLYGYPEWWLDLKAKKSKEIAGNLGRVIAVIAKPQLSLISLVDHNNESINSRSLVDSGVVDHMTYCSNDFTNSTTPRQTHVTNANGYHIQFQDWHNILTKEIIRRGTKRKGIYHVDDFNSSKINIVQHIDGQKQKLLQLCHCCLGHPSYGYMKHLLQHLFSNVGQFELQCETCILSRSHCLIPIKSDILFFIHIDVWVHPLSPPYHELDDLTMEESLLTTSFMLTSKLLDSSMKLHAFILHNKTKHILEKDRALLIGSHAPNKYWEDSVSTTVHLINRLPTKALNFSISLQALVTSSFLLKFLVAYGISEDSPIEIIGHGKATRETTNTRIATQAETDLVQFDEAKHDEAMIATLLSNVPDDNSPKVVHEVRSLKSSLDENSYIGYKLPFKHNSGKLPNRYSPKIEKACSKYLIANYMSSCDVLTRLQQALLDFNWSHAIQEEMRALEKNNR
ncbi:hypothetical protein CR513_47815, partial [Mucuna pruriens]